MAAGMLEPKIGLNGWELLFYQHEWQSAGCRTCVEGNWASATCIQVQITEVCIIHETGAKKIPLTSLWKH